MLKSNVRPALLALSLALGTGALFAPTRVVQAQEFRVPETAEDHLALAKMYEQKAATYRQEVEYHRRMFEAYKKQVATSPKATQPSPWVVKMQRHCQQLAKDAEKLAIDADKAAEYHRLRAKELQGG